MIVINPLKTVIVILMKKSLKNKIDDMEVLHYCFIMLYFQSKGLYLVELLAKGVL